MKLLKTLFVFFLSFSAIGQTYTATDFDELDDAIFDAITYANGGETATIILDAGGLIVIDKPLRVIKHTDGKIIITKNDGDPDNEGLIGVPSIHWDDDFRFGFTALNSGDLEITNLTFKNFTDDSYGSSNCYAIWCQNGQSVNITDNVFENSTQGAFLSLMNVDIGKTVDISRNTVSNCKSGFFVGLQRTTPYDGLDGVTGGLLKIDNNILNDIIDGIVVYRIGSHVYANVEITYNTISNSSEEDDSDGIVIIRPLKGYVQIDHNQLTHLHHGIFLGGISSGEMLREGINFIGPNTIGLTQENQNNTILNCKYSFATAGSTNPFEINIVGLSFEGVVKVYHYPTVIRENKIKKPLYGDIPTFPPINLLSGNENIPSPTPISAELIGGGDEIEVTYSVSGLFSENGPFVVEFFEVDSDNSIVDYLGNWPLPGHYDWTYPTTLTGLSFASTNKIGITVTSMGTTPIDGRIGTSEMAYITPECNTCNTFKLVPGEKYWMSAWVQVEHPDPVKTYVNSEEPAEGTHLEVEFPEVGSPVQFYPTGEIIDGWQRIVGSFTVPSEVVDLVINLNADQYLMTYFDDVRIHPFNGSLKSYVYDGETFWLTSELDDNNYATFYEYDNEGGLIRIKKETSRGIVTIQETRSSTTKTDD